jgi:anthranilate phosphoribosyltransferase
LTSGEVLAHLGIPADGDSLDAAARLATGGVSYLSAAQFCPALERLKPIRQELGLRTVLNTIEKLLDPGRATCHVVGAFHGPALERLPQVMRGLGHSRGAVVQGTEASCDFSLSRSTRLIRFSAEGVEAIRLTPESLGIAPRPDVVLPEGGAAACGAATLAVLTGEQHPLRVGALLTAGAWLWLAGRADTPQAGLAMARESLESGRAHARLLASRRASPEVEAGTAGVLR